MTFSINDIPYYTGAATLALGFVGLLIGMFTSQKMPRFRFENKNVVITGGSSGIGLETARLLASRGAKVTILARRKEVLDDAVKDITPCCANGGSIEAAVCDVGNPDTVKDVVRDIVIRKGAVQLLICCAGNSIPRRFLDTTAKETADMMNVNYFGCVNMIRAALPGMVERKFGRVVVVSSMVSGAPVAGFSIYAPSKSAARVLAQSLDMEHAALGVRFQVANPPDVDTPGYREENLVKSPECARISQASGAVPWKAEDIAKELVQGIETYSFQINFGFEGWMLGVLTAGMETSSSATQLVLSFFFMGLIRVVCTVYTKVYYGIVYDERVTKAAAK